MEIRVIPVLLLKNDILYKGVNFKGHKYIGDPINAVKIFNEKEVDELVFLDIGATLSGAQPNYEFLNHVASECFMPLCYGGGVNKLEQIEKLLYAGVEKICINTAAVENEAFIKEATEEYGSSTIMVSIDVKKQLFGGQKVYTHSGSKKTKLDPLTFAKRMEDLGIGEILINSIDKDGTMKGFDVDLVQTIASQVGVPVVAAGGAGSLKDFQDVVHNGKASAVAAGSYFVFQGKHKAVLITYPDRKELEKLF
jgi:cyclase